MSIHQTKGRMEPDASHQENAQNLKHSSHTKRTKPSTGFWSEQAPEYLVSQQPQSAITFGAPMLATQQRSAIDQGGILNTQIMIHGTGADPDRTHSLARVYSVPMPSATYDPNRTDVLHLAGTARYPGAFADFGSDCYAIPTASNSSPIPPQGSTYAPCGNSLSVAHAESLPCINTEDGKFDGSGSSFPPQHLPLSLDRQEEPPAVSYVEVPVQGSIDDTESPVLSAHGKGRISVTSLLSNSPRKREGSHIPFCLKRAHCDTGNVEIAKRQRVAGEADNFSRCVTPCDQILYPHAQLSCTNPAIGRPDTRTDVGQVFNLPPADKFKLNSSTHWDGGGGYYPAVRIDLSRTSGTLQPVPIHSSRCLSQPPALWTSGNTPAPTGQVCLRPEHGAVLGTQRNEIPASNTIRPISSNVPSFHVGHGGQTKHTIIRSDVRKDRETQKAVPTDRNVLQCPRCPRKFHFEERIKLSCHIQGLHESTANGCCGLCGFQCKDRADLGYHVWKKHERNALQQNPSHVCSMCGQAFASKSRMEMHLSTQHKIQQTFECKKCYKKFRKKDNMVWHSYSCGTNGEG